MTKFEGTRRSALMGLAALTLAPTSRAWAAAAQIVVHKDPNCGCCTAWVQHLQMAGYSTRTIETLDLNAVKARLRVPVDLAACHTAEAAGYVLEGHVPAEAVNRLLTEKPDAVGLAVAGMPAGSPGMEAPNPVPYDVVLFGTAGRRTYMRFLGTKAI